jgi:hypothetical protein
MLQVVLIVTRTMTTTATAVMDTDQIMATDHMRPGMDTHLTDHMRRHLDLERIGHLRVPGVPGGGDCHLLKTLCFMSS